MSEFTVRELQDAINRRLERLAGRKFDSRKRSYPEYHNWYIEAITSELTERGISIFQPMTWRIVAEIDEPEPIKVSIETVAEVIVDVKRDRRYTSGGPGTVISASVHFREDLLDLTISGARVRLLEEEKAARIAYHREEREKALAAAEEAAAKIAELETVKIAEAGA